jgi:hypothetical protein
MVNGSGERPAGLRFLDRLVGTWRMTGGTEGRLTYEWMDGGFFLIARGDINQQGQRLKHIEIIGYQHPVEATGPANVLTSRLFTSAGIRSTTRTRWTTKPSSRGTERRDPRSP